MICVDLTANFMQFGNMLILRAFVNASGLVCNGMPYIAAQVLGGIAAGGVLYIIATGKAGFDVSAGFASNGYGPHSPGATR